MGLDMQLVLTYTITDESKVREITDRVSLPSIGVPLVFKCTVLYWKKANAIHGWFVRNVEQHCNSQEVSLSQLHDLHELCKDLLQTKNVASCKLRMPRMHGYFFGSQDQDEQQFDDLQYTLDKLEALLNWCETVQGSFHFTQMSDW